MKTIAILKCVIKVEVLQLLVLNDDNAPITHDFKHEK